MRPRTAAVLLFAVSAAPPLAAQGFEAASIKRSPPGDPRPGAMEFLPGGRFRATNMPMLLILGTAYNVPWAIPETLRIKGVPDWIITQRYDMEATSEKPEAAAGAITGNERIRAMLRAVLADRLQLRTHREVVEMPVYGLTIGAHGPKLEKSKIAEENCSASAPIGSGGCHQFMGGMGRGLHGEAVDMADVALYASNWCDRPIIDETGLGGLYNIQTEPWGTPIFDDPSRASLFDIFEALGLRLVPKKGLVEFFVIEHVEQPSAN
jgi:uncharacterized protein (TIGR03435 family)